MGGSDRNNSDYGSYLMHQRCPILLWAFLANIQILVALFYKVISRYRYIHGVRNTLILLLTILFV